MSQQNIPYNENNKILLYEAFKRIDENFTDLYDNKRGEFIPIEENHYGVHPEFATEEELFNYLLQQVKTPYDLAIEDGFTGTLTEWLESLKGEDGKDLYEIWLENNPEGTTEEFWVFIKPSFTTIPENSYGTHPAFNSQNELNVWLIQNGGTNIDTEAPSIPSNLTYTDLTDTSFTLNWDVSSGNPSHYKVYNDGNIYQDNVVNNTIDVTNQTPLSTSIWTVTSVDSSNNESEPSQGLSITLEDTPDTEPPSTPTMVVSNLTDTSATITMSSTDNVGVVSYKLYGSDQTELDTSVNGIFSLTELIPETPYNYYGKALDVAGNESSFSSVLSFTTETSLETPLETYQTKVLNDGGTYLNNPQDQNYINTIVGEDVNVLTPSGYNDNTLYSLKGDDWVYGAGFSEILNYNGTSFVSIQQNNIPRIVDVNNTKYINITKSATCFNQYNNNFTAAGAWQFDNILNIDNTGVIPSIILGQNASEIVPNTTNTFHRIGQPNIQVTNDELIGKITLSIFVKPNGINYVCFRYKDGTANQYYNAGFDLINETVTNLRSGDKANVIKYGDGWFRVFVTLKYEEGTVSMSPYFCLSNEPVTSHSIPQFLGNETDGVYIDNWSVCNGELVNPIVTPSVNSVSVNGDELYIDVPTEVTQIVYKLVNNSEVIINEPPSVFNAPSGNIEYIKFKNTTTQELPFDITSVTETTISIDVLDDNSDSYNVYIDGSLHSSGLPSDLALLDISDVVPPYMEFTVSLGGVNGGVETLNSITRRLETKMTTSLPINITQTNSTYFPFIYSKDDVGNHWKLNKNYGMLYSTDHDTGDGGLYWAEFDSIKFGVIKGFKFGGLILSEFQSETPALIIDESNVDYPVLIMYHTNGLDPDNNLGYSNQETHVLGLKSLQQNDAYLHEQEQIGLGKPITPPNENTDHTGYAFPVKTDDGYVITHLAQSGSNPLGSLAYVSKSSSLIGDYVTTPLNPIDRTSGVNSDEDIHPISWYYFTHNNNLYSIVRYTKNTDISYLAIASINEISREVTGIVLELGSFYRLRNLIGNYDKSTGILLAGGKQGRDNSDVYHPFISGQFDLNLLLP